MITLTTAIALAPLLLSVPEGKESPQSYHTLMHAYSDMSLIGCTSIILKPVQTGAQHTNVAVVPSAGHCIAYRGATFCTHPRRNPAIPAHCPAGKEDVSSASGSVRTQQCLAQTHLRLSSATSSPSKCITTRLRRRSICTMAITVTSQSQRKPSPQKKLLPRPLQ